MEEKAHAGKGRRKGDKGRAVFVGQNSRGRPCASVPVAGPTAHRPPHRSTAPPPTPTMNVPAKLGRPACRSLGMKGAYEVSLIWG